MLLKVADGLWRGANPSLVEMKAMKQVGVVSLLSLETGIRDLIDGKPFSEDQLSEETGLKLFHEPLSNVFPAGVATVLKCLAIIAEGIRAGGIFVHCRFGKDRTGYIIAAYRVIVQGWAVDRAIAEWKENGFHKVWYWWWPFYFKYMIKKAKILY